MMLKRVLGLAALVASPNFTTAQFGLGGNRRQQGGASFQELQELAKKQQQAAGAADAAAGAAAGIDMAKMMEEAMKDPAALEYLEKMGHNVEQAMESLSKMTPEEMEQQMKAAMATLTDDSMMDQILQSRNDVLKQLEMTNAIPADELVKMKADPAYFELKMRESFGQVQQMFDNPEMAGMMADAMKGMQELFASGGDLMKEIEKLVESGDLTDDSKIEEARQALLKGDFATNPLLKEMLAKDEIQQVIHDQSKFRDSVKEGQNTLGLGAGAGIGEL